MSTDFSTIEAAGLISEGSYTPDKLLDRDTKQRKVTIASGSGVLARGALLGQITSGGKYRLSLSASSDGSQVPDAILLEPVDATSADQQVIVAIAGSFNTGGVIFGASHTAASTDSVLRDKNIYLEAAIG